MIKVDNIVTFGFEHAIRGMRNPMNSWDRSDSDFDGGKVEIGPADLGLMKKLYKAGAEHRKYMRQIFCSFDLTSNHIFWQEFDTYKVGVTRNSCSKMHRIHVKPFEPEDFSHEGIDQVDRAKKAFDMVLWELEFLRKRFNDTGEKKYWRAMIELLPMGYNIRATITMTYENAVNMIRQRSGHKMDEWREFVKILRGLPCLSEIMAEEDDPMEDDLK